MAALARTHPGNAKPASRKRAAGDLAVILDSKLFKALCEPVRVEIVKTLAAEGRCNLGAIAARFPQDVSVVSRHLAILHEAGVVKRQKEGRHVYYDVDGSRVLAQMEAIVVRLHAVVAACCPPGGTSS